MILRAFAKKELLNNLVSFRFIIIFLLCCTLILVSAYTMRDKYGKRMKEYSAAVKIHRQELVDGQRDDDLQSIAMNGYKLDKPPTPLSTIVEGMEGSAGRFAKVNVMPLSKPLLEGGTGDDPMFVYFGTLDIMYIVRSVLSLVAILLTYDAISGERENGTLKLALSNSVPRHVVLLAKCIGGYITFLLSFLVPALIGLLILITSGNVSFSGAGWLRLILILLASVLYMGFFLMLGLTVSSRTSRSVTALMILLFIWVVAVMAVPKISTIIAAQIRHVPSLQEVEAEKDAVAAQIMREGQERLRREMQEKGGPQIRGVLLDHQMIESINKEKGEIDANYESKKLSQFRLASQISRISPASAYTYAAIGLAGTGMDRQERFLDSISSYKMEFAQYFDGIIKKQDGGNSDNARFEVGKMPTFSFREMSISESWSKVKIDVLILFLLVICFFMIAYVGFIRGELK